MKNSVLIAIIVVFGLLCLGCQRTPDEIRAKIQVLEMEEDELRATREALHKENRTLQAQVSEKIASIAQLDERLAAGEDPVYILTLHISKSSFTFSPAKDAMNSFDFDIAVDRELYDAVRIGSDLTSSFTMGSLLFGGNVGSISVEVKKRRIEPRH